MYLNSLTTRNTDLQTLVVMNNLATHTHTLGIVLYCIVLYCIVLYCIVLYCINCIVLYGMVLYCIVLYCIVSIVLYCIVLYCIVLYLVSCSLTSLTSGIIYRSLCSSGDERLGYGHCV